MDEEEPRWLDTVTKGTWSSRKQRHIGMPPVPWPIDEDTDEQLRSYPRGRPEDYQITYLKPIFVNPLNTWGPRDSQVKVVTERLGDVLNLRQCYHYLNLFHPQTVFSDEHVSRCLKVFQIALQHVNHVEFITGNDEEFYEWSFGGEDQYYVNFSTFYRPRRTELKSMLRVADQSFSEKDYVGSGFTLCELIFSPDKFAIFEREWGKNPTHESIRKILLAFFPSDIVNKIFEMTCSPHPKAH